MLLNDNRVKRYNETLSTIAVIMDTEDRVQEAVLLNMFTKYSNDLLIGGNLINYIETYEDIELVNPYLYSTISQMGKDLVLTKGLRYTMPLKLITGDSNMNHITTRISEIKMVLTYSEFVSRFKNMFNALESSIVQYGPTFTGIRKIEEDLNEVL